MSVKTERMCPLCQGRIFKTTAAHEWWYIDNDRKRQKAHYVCDGKDCLFLGDENGDNIELNRSASMSVCETAGEFNEEVLS